VTLDVRLSPAAVPWPKLAHRRKWQPEGFRPPLHSNALAPLDLPLREAIAIDGRIAAVIAVSALRCVLAVAVFAAWAARTLLRHFSPAGQAAAADKDAGVRVGAFSLSPMDSNPHVPPRMSQGRAAASSQDHRLRLHANSIRTLARSEVDEMEEVGKLSPCGHAKRSVVPLRCASAQRPPTTEAVDRDAAVDAKNAPTAAWKTRRRVSHRRPGTREKQEERPAMRAHAREKESDDTHATYRVPLFKRSSVAAFERSVTLTFRRRVPVPRAGTLGSESWSKAGELRSGE
jgi:hypothetical protein